MQCNISIGIIFRDFNPICKAGKESFLVLTRSISKFVFLKLLIWFFINKLDYYINNKLLKK